MKTRHAVLVLTAAALAGGGCYPLAATKVAPTTPTWKVWDSGDSPRIVTGSDPSADPRVVECTLRNGQAELVTSLAFAREHKLTCEEERDVAR